MAPSPDATQVDPLNHRIVLENEHVRVLEVRNPTGQELPTHSHPPRVIVAIGGYRLRSIDAEGVEAVIDRRPGEAIWVDHEEHSAAILIGPTHVIEVEVKSAAG